jgi:hypothetical protein
MALRAGVAGYVRIGPATRQDPPRELLDAEFQRRSGRVDDNMWSHAFANDLERIQVLSGRALVFNAASDYELDNNVLATWMRFNVTFCIATCARDNTQSLRSRCEPSLA